MPKRINSLSRLSAAMIAVVLLTPAAAAARRAYAPTAVTGSASSVNSSSAVLGGSVNPNNSSTNYYFQYGASTSYGDTTPIGSLSSGTSATAVQASVSSLSPGVTYHYRIVAYRIVAYNALGTRYGSDATFTTSTTGSTTTSTSTTATTTTTTSSTSTTSSSGDTTAPGAPSNLSAVPGDAQVSLSWGASTDNVGVAGYRVYRNGAQVAQVATTSYADSGLTDGTTYTYYVVAYDAAGNVSSASNSASALPVSPGLSGSSYDSVVVADHPVAFWDMDTPGGIESDVSGNGHGGTYKGGIPTLTTMLNGDRAVDFNGSSEYMTVTSSGAFSISATHQLTWEAWIRPDVLQWSRASDPYGYGYVDFMGKCQDYSPTCEWEARMYASVNSQNRCSRLSAYVFNPSAGLGSGADWQKQCNLLRAGQWLHVVGEYQTLSTPSDCNSAYPGTVNIWVNGVEWNASDHYPTGCMSQYSIGPATGSSALDIGTMALDSWFPGAVGKVAIYDHLLNQGQIDAHFVAMTGSRPRAAARRRARSRSPAPSPG
jgi:chitodextrinase